MASRERKFRFKTRKFLNLDGWHGNASIIAWVERGNKRSGRRFSAALSISDCSNTINIDIDAYSVDSRRNSMHKLDTLVTELTKFRDAVAVEVEALNLNEVLYGEDEEF